jgi:hypothetical protein
MKRFFTYTYYKVVGAVKIIEAVEQEAFVLSI